MTFSGSMAGEITWHIAVQSLPVMWHRPTNNWWRHSFWQDRNAVSDLSNYWTSILWRDHNKVWMVIPVFGCMYISTVDKIFSGRGCCACMVVGFTTTCAISAYHH
jgi:hypothetical protein